MNHQEIRHVLSAYRARGAAASDPLVADALRRAEADPHLRDWWQREQAWDNQFSSALRAVPVPEALRAQLLTGARAQRAVQKPSWSWGTWAAAAALVFGLGGAWAWPSVSTARTQTLLVQHAQRDLVEGQHGGGGANLRRWEAALWSAENPTALAVGDDREALAREGCRTFSLSGRLGLEICFSHPEGEFHLYLLETGFGGERALQRREWQGRLTLSWVREGVAYALVSDDAATRPALERWAALGGGR